MSRRRGRRIKTLWINVRHRATPGQWWEGDGGSLAWSAESKLLLVGFPDKDGGKRISQIDSAGRVRGDMFICTRDGATSHCAAAVGVAPWLSYCSRFRCTRLSSAQAKRRAAWGCGGNHHPCIFQALDGSTDLCNPSWKAPLSFFFF